MNNTQLYLSIGIPSFLVILAWLSNRADIHKMGDRIDKVEDTLRSEMVRGFDASRTEMRKELDGMRSELNRGLDGVRGEMIAFRREIQADMTKGLDGVRGEMIAFRREMHSDMVPLHERVAVVEARTEKM